MGANNEGLVSVPEVGTIVPEMVSIPDPAAVLFGRTRRGILSLLFTRPDEGFYLREIVRRTGGGIGAVQRELGQLTECGIVRRDEGRFFRANSDSPIYGALKDIVVRTMGVGDVLRRALRSVEERVAVAFVFGSFARGEQRESSDVDVMVVAKGDGLSIDDVAAALSKAQEELGREVNSVRPRGGGVPGEVALQESFRPAGGGRGEGVPDRRCR
jgi:predicted nucleotidyltransferase